MSFGQKIVVAIYGGLGLTTLYILVMIISGKPCEPPWEFPGLLYAFATGSGITWLLLSKLGG